MKSHSQHSVTDQIPILQKEISHELSKRKNGTAFSQRLWVALRRAVVFEVLFNPLGDLLGTGVLGHRLCPFRHRVLGQMPGQQQAHGGLDLAGADGAALVVMGPAGSLTCTSS